eukprot:comp16368_c0_seq1/m.26104 comp16368_c0_seq1/g.26104  ORF comp16368_c0_seq1/g.26104 comp16368_c0_seq1/m.26104 type:complete len:274 (+) comp16368_c0_seq1:39-860(+)
MNMDIEREDNSMISLVRRQYTPHRHISLQFVPFLPVVVGLFTIVTTIVLFWVKGNNRPQSPDFWWPSVSRTGAAYPEIIFFSIGLHAIGFIAMFLGWCVFAVYEAKFEKAEFGAKWVGTARNLNRFMFVTMVVFFITILATGSISLEYSPEQHGLMAGIMFLAGCIYILANSLLVHNARSLLVKTARDRFWLKYKLSISISTFALGLIYIIILGPFQKRVKPTCIGPEHYCTLRNVRNVLEYFLIGGLNLFFVSFYSDLRDFTVAVCSQSTAY